MKALALAALLGAALAACLFLPRRETPSLWDEPEDGVQPPDPRPASFVLTSGPLDTASIGTSLPPNVMPYWTTTAPAPPSSPYFTIGTTTRQTH